VPVERYAFGPGRTAQALAVDDRGHGRLHASRGGGREQQEEKRDGKSWLGHYKSEISTTDTNHTIMRQLYIHLQADELNASSHKHASCYLGA
jgi:hypothetical protein